MCTKKKKSSLALVRIFTILLPTATTVWRLSKSASSVVLHASVEYMYRISPIIRIGRGKTNSISIYLSNTGFSFPHFSGYQSSFFGLFDLFLKKLRKPEFLGVGEKACIIQALFCILKKLRFSRQNSGIRDKIPVFVLFQPPLRYLIRL